VIAMCGRPSLPSTSSLSSTIAKHFEKVIVVLGNHEYYHGEKSQVEAEVRKICSRAPDKLLFGNKYSGLLISGVRVLATTLWSHVPNEEEHINGVWKGLNDYRVSSSMLINIKASKVLVCL